ncbi:hypothetical protein ONS95_014143 [Cadophora gregata]|uniref:uncharacterized protein n=1 Tax=Cadophora gregata TaxID=51156 RepID=UPI0026DBA4D9|nr:uncharacterized protein ONS95_014143 [Cadophora gregata]KAK0113900.1 hypothetical protein ONS96_014750 [Cadophora gregata f. sp. sojae]KAK0114658.1 hypothetical protein ONS95_014143 [Cadophora gregata]
MAVNYQDTLLFDGYNLTSAREIRFLAVAMKAYNNGLGNGFQTRALSDQRKATITRVAIQMAGSASLSDAIGTLVVADRESDDIIIASGRMLQNFTYEAPPKIRPSIKPVPTDPLPRQLVGKNAPGVRAIKDPSLDISFARHGTPDKSKYKFKIDFEKPNPYMSSKWDYYGTKFYNWLDDHDEPSWDSAASLSRLNQWRSQIFKRYFGLKRQPRDHWVVSEKNLVVKLMEKDLENSAFVRWKRLANNFNQAMKGQIQSTDELLVSQLIGHKDYLDEERMAPWRTLGAIKAQTTRWVETRSLEAEALAGETSEVESSDDEEEMPDPATESEKIAVANGKRKQPHTRTMGNCKSKKAKKTIKSKGKGKRKHKEVEDTETEDDD